MDKVEQVSEVIGGEGLTWPEDCIRRYQKHVDKLCKVEQVSEVIGGEGLMCKVEQVSEMMGGEGLTWPED